MTKPSSCTPCNCIPGQWHKDTFMQSVMVVLCALYNATIPGGKTEAAPIYGTLAFGSLDTTYKKLVDNDGTARTLIEVYNGLDVDVHYSFNGTTVKGVIPSFTRVTIELGANGLQTIADFYIADDIDAATQGYIAGTMY